MPVIIFKDPARRPFWFVHRVYHTEGASSYWYVYLDRISPPIIVKDSEILQVIP